MRASFSSSLIGCTHTLSCLNSPTGRSNTILIHYLTPKYTPYPLSHPDEAFQKMSSTITSLSPPSVATTSPPTTTSDPFSEESMAATAALFTSPLTTATFDASNLYDPLKINLKKQVRELIQVLSNLSPVVSGRLDDVAETLSGFIGASAEVEVKEVLNAVSKCLGVPQLAEGVVRLFRPLLIDLFARWLEGGLEGEGEREERLAVLAFVVEVFEEVYP